jgi:hypothetical protein
MSPQEVKNILDRNFAWLCNSCTLDAFPFTAVENNELIDTFSDVSQFNQPTPQKKKNVVTVLEGSNKMYPLFTANAAAISFT